MTIEEWRKKKNQSGLLTWGQRYYLANREALRKWLIRYWKLDTEKVLQKAYPVNDVNKADMWIKKWLPV